MTFFHGIQVAEPVDGVRPIRERSTAVIGLVVTATAGAGDATNALNAAFPINRPVLITDVRRAIAAAGTGGTLGPVLQSIADQGSPLVVVVRVAAGANVAATSEAVVGGSANGAYTGMQALIAAESIVGVRPRILGAPGLDTPSVVAALVVLAKRLRGFAYAAVRADTGALVATRDLAVTARGDYEARELMLLWPGLVGHEGKAVACALGVRAMLDETVGWHRSISNVAINGVTGLTRDVGFDLRDASSDAGVLNAAPVTTVIRANGFRFWGNRTTSDEEFFSFEVAARTAQAVQDAIADAEAQFLDRPMTAGLVRDVVETANARLALYVAQGRLIGGHCWYDADLNPAEALAAGKLAIDYDYTYVAPMEALTLNQRVTAKYYLTFAEQLTE